MMEQWRCRSCQGVYTRQTAATRRGLLECPVCLRAGLVDQLVLVQVLRRLVAENQDPVNHAFADFQEAGRETRYVLAPGDVLELALPEDSQLLAASPHVIVREVPAWEL